MATFQCNRCGHSWPSKREAKDIHVCPKCKNPYWNAERMMEVPKRDNTTDAVVLKTEPVEVVSVPQIASPKPGIVDKGRPISKLPTVDKGRPVT